MYRCYKCKYKPIGIVDYTAVTVFCGVMPNSLVEIYLYFRRTYCLYLHC
jgi:hypothetical protein